MTPWQRRLRLTFALSAVALAIVVALAFQRRVDFRPGTVGSSDPKALIETIDFNKTRVNRDKEEVRIQAGVMRAYGDGTAKGEKLIVTTVRSGGARVAIEVRDRGTGISAENLPRIFDPYFTTRHTGTGLGLAISRNIVEGLRGTIAVNSRAGEGTTVRIELPVQ